MCVCFCVCGNPRKNLFALVASGAIFYSSQRKWASPKGIARRSPRERRVRGEGVKGNLGVCILGLHTCIVGRHITL